MKLSVITVNYNNLSGLRKTYESIASQTFRGFEWLVVDGGSTDGSKEFLQQHNTELAWWCSEPDHGVYDAMNKGVRMAQGEYLSFMNSGDCFHDSRVLEEVFESAPSADVVYGDWVERYTDKEVYRTIPLKELGYTLLHQNICHQALFVRRALLCEEGYNQQRFGLIADWAHLTQMILRGKTIAHLPLPICYYDMYGLTSQKVPDLSREHAAIMALYPEPIRDSLYQLRALKEHRYVNHYLRLATKKPAKKIIHFVLKTLALIYS